MNYLFKKLYTYSIKNQLFHFPLYIGFTLLLALSSAPRVALAAPLPAPNAACDLEIEIIAAPYAVVDSNMPGVQGPQVAMLGARVTNRSAETQTDLQVRLGDGTTPGKFIVSSGGSLGLQAKQAATQRLNILAAGQTETFYWAVNYPPTLNISYAYTIWATTGGGCQSRQSSQIKTERQISASANKLLPRGAMVVVSPNVVTPGALVTVKIIGFTLGTVGQGPNSTYDAWLQPVGNADFDPSCLRFTQSKVLLNSISTTPFEDRLYFTNLKNYRQDSRDYVEYRFVALRSCNTAIQPYQEAASGTQEKYNDDYAASISRVNVLCSSTNGLKLTLATDKTVAAIGEKVRFQANFVTTTGQFGSPGTGSPAVVTAALPPNSSYSSGSATTSTPATVEYSADGGQSWQSTAGTTVTHLRWLLNEPVATLPQAVTYDVVVNAPTAQCLTGNATLGLLNAPTLLSASAAVNCAPTPTPTPSPTATPPAEIFVQSAGAGGLESGPLPAEPSSFSGGVGITDTNATAANLAATELRWHKARLLETMQLHLEDIIPNQGPANTTAKSVVPVDVLAVTNAPEAKGVDFVDGAGRVQAVVLGILSVGGPYEHDYGVCNRFKDYVVDTLAPIATVLPNGENGWFWHSHAVKQETIQEDALFLHVFVDETNKKLHVDSRWIKDQYPKPLDFAFDYVFNLQLWSNNLAKTQELLSGILTKMAQLDNGSWQLVYHNQQTQTAADVFVRQTTYHADEIQLSIWNRTAATQPVHLYGAWRSHTERNTLQPFDYTLDLPADQSDLKLPFPGLLDATIYIESNGFIDKIYQGGGLWFTVKGNQATAPTLTLGQCRTDLTLDVKDLVLAGCAEVTTAALGTNAQVGIGRTLNPNGRPVDISPYQALRFWAKGDGTPVRVILETAGVTDNDYYQTVFTPDATWQQYMLPLTKFAQSSATTALAGTDVRAVIWTNAEATERPMTLAIDQVSFTNQGLLTIINAPQDDGATTPRLLQVEKTDDSPLASLLAYYSIDQGATFQSIALTPAPGRQTAMSYQGELPGQPLGSDVLYYLEATYPNGYVSRTPIDAPASYYRYRVDDRAGLLVDDFVGPALQNRLGLGNGVFNQPTAGGRLLTYHEDGQLVLDYDVAAAEQFAGYFTYLPSLNVTPYTTIDLLLRGAVGGEQVRVGLRNGQNIELFINLGDLLPGGITTAWQWVQIPLSSFAPRMDLTDVESLSFFFSNDDGATTGRLYVQELRLTTLAAPRVLDNFDDAALNDNGQMMEYWSVAPNSSLTPTLVDGDARKTTGKALRLDYTIGANGYAIWRSNLKDVAVAADALLTAWVKGGSPSVKTRFYLTDGTKRTAITLADYVTVRDQWQLVQVPLSAFTAQGLDATHVTGFEVVFEHGTGSGTFWLDNVQIGGPGAPQAGQRRLYMYNDDSQPLALHLANGGAWSATSNVAWLATQTTGAGPDSLTIQSVNWQLTPGVYNGTVQIKNAADQSEAVTVVLTITEAGAPTRRHYLPLIAR